MINACWNEQRNLRWGIGAIRHELSASMKGAHQEDAEDEQGNHPASRLVAHIEVIPFSNC